MASHKRACRSAVVLRGTGVVVSTLAVAGFATGVGHAEPPGGSPNRDAGRGNDATPGRSRPVSPGAGSKNTAPNNLVADPPASGDAAAVEQQIAGLYQQVDADSQAYDADEERIAQLQALVASDGSRAAQLRDELAAASASLGRMAAQQYRDAGLSPELALVFAAHPDAYLERAGMNDRLADIARRRVIAALTDQRDLDELDRESATGLADLRATQQQLAAHRAAIEAQLADARLKLDSLGGTERQEVTAALARGGVDDGLGTTMSVAAPSLSTLIAAVTAPAATASPLPPVQLPTPQSSAAQPSSTALPGSKPTSSAKPSGIASSSASSPALAASALNPSPAASSGGASSSAAPAGGADPRQVTGQPVDSGNAAREVKAISAAYSELGRPYVWGATGPDQFDCSGLTQHAWAAAGVILPRTSQEQAGSGKAVPISGIRPGDLVIYYPGQSHVGIYVGDGLVIHAPRPGSVVQFAPVDSMPIDKVVRPEQ